MEPLVALAVLGASLLHASWHALVKSTGDRLIALAGVNAVSTTVALALLPFTRPLPAMVYGVIALSVLVHMAYKLSLARLYDHADLGQGYALARGLTPVMASLLALVFLGETVGTGNVAGILLIGVGLALLAFEGPGRRISLAALGAAAAVGLAVAAYSVIDACGVRLANDWISFTVWLILLDGSAFITCTLALRGAKMTAAWRAEPGKTLMSGMLGTVSFTIFIWALARAPVGPVSALRESSVLFAALIGALVLKERATWRRYAAALAVMLGMGIIALTP